MSILMRDTLIHKFTQMTQSYRDESSRALAVAVTREAEAGYVAAPAVDHESDDDMQHFMIMMMMMMKVMGPSLTEVESR